MVRAGTVYRYLFVSKKHLVGMFTDGRISCVTMCQQNWRVANRLEVFVLLNRATVWPKTRPGLKCAPARPGSARLTVPGRPHFVCL